MEPTQIAEAVRNKKGQEIYANTDWKDEKGLKNNLKKLHVTLGHASSHKLHKMLENFPPQKGVWHGRKS